MQFKLEPSAVQFVARLPEETKAEAVFASASSIADWKPISGHPELWLIGLKSPFKDPRSAWKKISQALGGRISIAPVFLDEQQQPRYPTGKVTARFQKPPSDDELADLSRSAGLGEPARNKFVRTQVSFMPSSSRGVFLPDAIKSIEGSGHDLVDVWPDTLSQYQRAGGA